ncbi:MAG: hypothetical protein ABF446_09880, partial [Acetobacter orientalis]|uniref:hypothetical protein n=1 Tax=Acetobacter orientalis TaxID=146474 RepID=UPI0039E7B9DC
FVELSKISKNVSVWRSQKSKKITRLCFLSNEVLSFLKQEHTNRIRGKTSIKMQAVNLLESIATTPNLASVGQFTDAKPMFPIRKLKPTVPSGPNVWEMRTTDVRLFGWVHTIPNVFFVTFPELKQYLVDKHDVALPMEYDRMIFYVLDWLKTESVDNDLIWKKDNADAPIHFRV